MNIENLADISKEKFAEIENELANRKTLGQVLTWAGAEPKGAFLPNIVAETVAQDEYTIDVVIPFRDLFLVFDTTWLGAITAVAVWKHQPNADEILEYRLKSGWMPTPSALKDGDEILGHASGGKEV